MADAYNVRTDGKFYYVYRLDGNVQVSQHSSGAEAQRSAAIQNQRYNEQFGKKKEAEPASESTVTKSDWVETQIGPEQGIGKGYVPDPPPGQGVSY
jgi:hypothetical protein